MQRRCGAARRMQILRNPCRQYRPIQAYGVNHGCHGNSGSQARARHTLSKGAGPGGDRCSGGRGNHSLSNSLPDYPLLAEFRPEALQAIPNVMAPLLVIALFIERAVEVILAAWRAGGTQHREAGMQQAMEQGTIDEQWRARTDLDAYRVDTQRTAFALAFVISLLISTMGVRAIEMLVGPDLLPRAAAEQRLMFVRVDVFVTSLLLTGGAEGIHKVVNAFTTFMDSTQDRMKKVQ